MNRTVHAPLTYLPPIASPFVTGEEFIKMKFSIEASHLEAVETQMK